MKVFVLYACFVGLLHQTSAASWFGDRNNPADRIDALAATTDEEQRCGQLASWGRCEFYDCIESKFPCGRNGYTQSISKHFCSKIDEVFANFDAFGKRWLNQTSICLLTYMRPIYESRTSSCSAIKDAGIQAIIDCNDAEIDGKNFCDFLNTNSDAYSGLMDMEEVRLLASLRNPRVFTTMITNAVSCGVSNLATSAAGYFNSLVSSVSGLFWH